MPDEPASSVPHRVAKRYWVPALVINLLSAVLGIFWAVVFFLGGAIFLAGGVLGRGAGEQIEFLGLGFGTIALGVFVILAPFVLGTALAALRRRWSVALSLMVASISVLAPVLAALLLSLRP